MNFLDQVMAKLDRRDQKLLREILMSDEPPVSREEAEHALDLLRIRKIQLELADAESCIQDPEIAAPTRATLIRYARGLRVLLEPHAVGLREMFCRYKAERERARNGNT